MEFELFPGASLQLRISTESMMVHTFHNQLCNSFARTFSSSKYSESTTCDIFPGDVLHAGLPGWDHPWRPPRCPGACLRPEGADRGWRHGHHFIFVSIWIFPLELPQIKEKRNQLKMHKTGGWRIFLGVGRHPGRPPPHDFPGNHPDHPGHPGQPGHPGLPGRPGRLVVHSPPLLAGQVLCPCPVPNLLTNSIAIINSYKRHPPQRRVAAMPRQPWTSTPIVSSSTTASLIVVSNVTIP